MEQRDFEEINRFLVTVGKPTLFEYFGVGLDVAAEDAEAAIKQRRGWAQGQQSNPKFRAEALWVIKNVGLCRKALVDEKIAYLNEIEGKDRSRKLQVLRLFIMGTLADGVLTQKGEEAIREHGARLGLDADAIAAEIDTLVSEQQAQRGNVTDLSIALDAEFLKDDAKLVSETLLAAVQDAAQQAKTYNDAEMQKVTSAFQMPGMM